jgi:hypothetical protein
MAKTDYRSVDEYIAAQPEAVRGILQEVRGVIRKALPKAEEVISYQIPAYKIDWGKGDLFLRLEGALFALSRVQGCCHGAQEGACRL